MYRDIVFLQDAIVAISMVEASMAGSSLLENKSVVRSMFLKDPEAACILLLNPVLYLFFLNPRQIEKKKK
jgi:hypothetical protein